MGCMNIHWNMSPCNECMWLILQLPNNCAVKVCCGTQRIGDTWNHWLFWMTIADDRNIVSLSGIHEEEGKYIDTQIFDQLWIQVKAQAQIKM